MKEQKLEKGKKKEYQLARMFSKDVHYLFT